MGEKGKRSRVKGLKGGKGGVAGGMSGVRHSIRPDWSVHCACVLCRQQCSQHVDLVSQSQSHLR